MTIKKFLISAAFLFFSLLLISTTASARDWDDLYEEDEKVFGSEKEMKYNPDMFFLQRETWENHYSFMFLWIFKYTDYPKYSSVRLFPLYHTLESRIDNRTYSFIPITLTYWETDGIEKYRINPLFISGSSSDNKGWEDNYSVSWLHGYFYTKRPASEKPERIWWAPIIPLIYRSTDNWGGHMNVGWLLDYSWRRDKNGEETLKRFWMTPLLFHEPGDNGYTHMLPPVFLYNRHSNGEYWISLFPLFKRSKNMNYTYSAGKSAYEYEDSFKSLLFCYNSVYDGKWTGETKASEFWFPAIPLYYHSKDNEGTHTNLLWLIDWKRGSEGEMKRFWFIPFVFHEPGEGGYRFYMPFFFRPSGWTEEAGVTYSPLYYHKWSPEEDAKWTCLIHYKKSNSKTGDYLNTWVPFYYNHENPAEGETTWIAPLYYHHDSLEHKGYFTRIVAPLYWNFETDKRDTTLFLPLYFETAKKNGTGSNYINILGYSRSVLAGTNPVIDASLGTNQRGVYLDIDVSWLVEMASVSTRVTVPMKSGEEKIYEEEQPSGEITISKKNRVSRESSTNFWGFHALYGLMAFEKADSKRHLRILPLSWLTWDENSDDRIKVILNYVSYKQDETEYLVFFPFYGYQRIGESYSKGYMLNAYWHEYDHDKKMHEYTVLWPIINWYDSPEKEGWRVIPLVWHKNHTEDNILHSSTYTPLYMNRSRKKADDESSIYRLNLSLFHFYRYNEEKDETSTLWFSSIPVVFYKNNVTHDRHELPSSEDTASDEKNRTEEQKVYNDYKTSDTLRWIFPLYMVSETETEDKGSDVTTSDYTLFGLPLLYYHSVTEKCSDPAAAEKKNGTFFLLGYYNEFSSDSNSSSILFGLYKNEKYPDTEDYSYSALYGLFNVSDMDGHYENYFRPFYYYGDDNGKKEHSTLMGIYRSKNDSNNGDAGFSLLYGLYSTSHYHYTVDPDNRNIPLVTKEKWLIPVFYHSSTESSDAGKPWSDNLSLSFFHYRHDVEEPEEKAYTFWAPIVPLYYHSTDNQSSHTNILWFYDYEKGITGDYTRRWLLPFIYHKSGDDGYFHIAPLYFSAWDEKNNDNTYIICGLYLNSKPGYSRENFLYLYDHISNDSGNYHEYSMLFTTIEFEIDPEVKRIQALWGLLMDAEWTKSGYDIEGLLWLAAVEKDGGYFHTRALPLWYYESTETTHTLVIPPALTWDSKDSDDSKFQLWALGALWYRDYDPAEKSDLQAALLGIPYYKIQRAERGYESWGSLWGILWEYESESETGFSKFSLLKFIYKRVELDGEVQHRVLGITF